MNKNLIVSLLGVYAVVFIAVFLDENKPKQPVIDPEESVVFLCENGNAVCLGYGGDPEFYGNNENRPARLEASAGKAPVEKKERKFPTVSREALLTEPPKMKKLFPVYLKKRWRR